jgi:amino acid transporter
VFTIVNLAGAKLLSESNSVMVIWKTAVPVLTIILLLAVSFHPSNFTSQGFAPFGIDGIFAVLPAGVVFALHGFEQAIQMGGEAKDPQRDISRAVISAMLTRSNSRARPAVSGPRLPWETRTGCHSGPRSIAIRWCGMSA